MKSKYKKSLVISIFVFLSIILAGLLIYLFTTRNEWNQKPMEKKEGTIILGFSQIGSESAWRTRNTESIFEAAAENNIQILFDDAQQKQANQLKAIRSFIVYQVDVIAFVPIVETGWDNVLQEAKDANIPVIIVDRQIDSDPSLYECFVGENSYSEGQKVGLFLKSKCKNQDQTFNIIELSGTKNSSVSTARANGFRSIISSEEKFKIIYSKDGDFLRSRGKEIMDEILSKNRGLKIENNPIDVIYSHNDSMTLGLLDSLQEHKIDARNTIILSIDGEQKCIDALIEGKVKCIVECNPNQGPLLMQIVKDIYYGQEVSRLNYISETIFTENDEFSLYQPRGY